MKKIEFSKKLLIVDYTIMLVLFVCAIIFQEVDFVAIICAWIVQLGISSAAYYWKAKNDNRTKVPIKVIRSLPKDMRDQIDLTQIITSIIQSE
jgi:hypothetical protein